MILFEKETIEYLGLPSIPKKVWDGKSPFENSVAVVNMCDGRKAYAICSYNSDNAQPQIRRVFCQEPFNGIEKVFIVPSYMQSVSDVDNMDLDEDSKRKAKIILSEASELENDGVIDEPIQEPENEYYFPNISNDEEASAFITNYNRRNKIKGKVPKTHEGILMRLSVIYNDTIKNGKETN